MNLSVAKENIRRFEKMLAATTDPTQLALFSKILEREKESFAEAAGLHRHPGYPGIPEPLGRL
jgi:hypothetical protein